jgi:hypothetical protein
MADILNLQQARQERNNENTKLRLAAEANDVENQLALAAKDRIRIVLASISAAGYQSIAAFLLELLGAKDQQQSATVSRMILAHGEDILDAIRTRQAIPANSWAVKMTGEILEREGRWLASFLRPRQGSAIGDILCNFSLEKILHEVEVNSLYCPSSCWRRFSSTLDTHPNLVCITFFVSVASDIEQMLLRNAAA